MDKKKSKRLYILVKRLGGHKLNKIQKMSFENFKFYKPQFDKELSFCEEFLNNYEDDTMEPHPTWGRKKYLVQLVRFLWF